MSIGQQSNLFFLQILHQNRTGYGTTFIKKIRDLKTNRKDFFIQGEELNM